MRVTVVVLCVSVCVCVCVSVAALPATYLVSMSQTRCCKVAYRILIISIVWIYLKTLRSRVLASFAGRHHLPRSLTSFRWIKETVMVSFQLEEYVWLEIDPTR